MPISKSLRFLRIKSGLTQEEVGARLDPHVTKAAVASWESGKAKPRADKLTQLAQLFNVSVSDLMTDADSPALVGSSSTLQKISGGGPP